MILLKFYAIFWVRCGCLGDRLAAIVELWHSQIKILLEKLSFASEMYVFVRDIPIEKIILLSKLHESSDQ